MHALSMYTHFHCFFKNKYLIHNFTFFSLSNTSTGYSSLGALTICWLDLHAKPEKPIPGIFLLVLILLPVSLRLPNIL